MRETGISRRDPNRAEGGLMGERVDEVAARIDSLDRLGAVISAMRGVAAARVRQAEAQIQAVDRYAATIAEALGRAAALLPDPPPEPGGPPLVVAFLAQQGFAGGFSGRVLDSLDASGANLVLLGTRGATLAEERGVHPALRFALPTRASGMPRFADGLARSLPMDGRAVIDVVYAAAGSGSGSTVTRRRLFPFPVAGNLPPSRTPLLNLAPEAVLAALLGEALLAGLVQAALHSLNAETMARMLAMAAAEGQTERRLVALQAEERRVRQETITAEIVELTSGVAARRRGRAKFAGPPQGRE